METLHVIAMIAGFYLAILLWVVVAGLAAVLYFARAKGLDRLEGLMPTVARVSQERTRQAESGVKTACDAMAKPVIYGASGIAAVRAFARTLVSGKERGSV
ncbi:MAG: hypothetical protein HY329_14900 [Chloroflexi bacterium]|nr:hypothetical protein [Chloroflexota bacterium]